MSITIEDIERFMTANRACLDSRIWFREMRDGSADAQTLWRDLTRPDWRWWVLSKLEVSQDRTRAYLMDITRNLKKRALPGGFTGFPIDAIMELLGDRRSRMFGEHRAQLGYLARDAGNKRIGTDSFHFGVIEACENLAKSLLIQDEEYGYLKHAAINLTYAIDSAASAGIPYDHDDVRSGFGWPELQDTITSSDFFNLTPA